MKIISRLATITETVYGQKQGEQMEFLKAETTGVDANGMPFTGVAYLDGNGYVKLFDTIQGFFDWYLYECEDAESLFDMSQDDYNNDITFNALLIEHNTWGLHN